MLGNTKSQKRPFSQTIKTDFTIFSHWKLPNLKKKRAPKIVKMAIFAALSSRNIRVREKTYTIHKVPHCAKLNFLLISWISFFGKNIKVGKTVRFPRSFIIEEKNLGGNEHPMRLFELDEEKFRCLMKLTFTFLLLLFS